MTKLVRDIALILLSFALGIVAGRSWSEAAASREIARAQLVMRTECLAKLNQNAIAERRRADERIFQTLSGKLSEMTGQEHR